MYVRGGILSERRNYHPGLNPVIQHQISQIENISGVWELHKKKREKAGDFQRERSECAAVNFGHIVPRYRQDLTIS